MTDVACLSGPDGKNSVVNVGLNLDCLVYMRTLATARVPGAFYYWTLDASGSEARQEEQLELHHE